MRQGFTGSGRFHIDLTTPGAVPHGVVKRRIPYGPPFITTVAVEVRQLFYAPIHHKLSKNGSLSNSSLYMAISTKQMLLNPMKRNLFIRSAGISNGLPSS